MQSPPRSTLPPSAWNGFDALRILPFGIRCDTPSSWPGLSQGQEAVLPVKRRSAR
jgi:hypothetical protein